MGLLDDVMEQKNRETREADKFRAWSEVGASLDDWVALELTPFAKGLVEEFVASVPDMCWDNNEFRKRIWYCHYYYTGPGAQPGFVESHGGYVKYLAPDGTTRVVRKGQSDTKQGVRYGADI